LTNGLPNATRTPTALCINIQVDNLSLFSSRQDRCCFVHLSPNGFSNLQFDNYERDFTFIVGNDSYSCPRFVADFLSPRASKLHRSDPTVHSIEIETRDRDHYFEQFFWAGFGSSVCVKAERYALFRAFCVGLESSDFYDQLVQQCHGDLTMDNIIDRLTDLDRIGGSLNREVEFAFCGSRIGV
jgi:hypothetical protein